MISPATKKRIGALAAGSLCAILFLFGASYVYADYQVSTAIPPSGTPNGFGATAGSGGEFLVGQHFNTIGAGSVTAVELYVNTIGSVTDSPVVSIYSDLGGAPGTELASSTFTASNVYPSCAVKDTVTLSSPLAVTASTTYWIVLGRTGAANDSHRYGACGNSNTSDDVQYSLSTAPSTWAAGIAINGTKSEISSIVDVVESSASTTATTTIQYVDNPTQDVMNGFILFFIGLFGSLWLLRRLKT